jgi:hypothetical protein
MTLKAPLHTHLSSQEIKQKSKNVEFWSWNLAATSVPSYSYITFMT